MVFPVRSVETDIEWHGEWIEVSVESAVGRHGEWMVYR